MEVLFRCQNQEQIVEAHELFLLGGCLQRECGVGVSEKCAEFEHLVCRNPELECESRVMEGWGLNLNDVREKQYLYIL
jgi:hypothetical protein